MRSLGAALLASLLSACGGSATPPITQETTKSPLSSTVAFITTSPATPTAHKLYVADEAGGIIATYNANDGTRINPTIQLPQNTYPCSVAADKYGKIYVGSTGTGPSQITTYNSDGTQTTPTIAVSDPCSIAVDQNSKIYVANPSANNVTIYNPNGNPASFPKSFTVPFPTSLAVNSVGDIYVANASTQGTCALGCVTMFTPDGIPTQNYPVTGLVAVDSSDQVYVGYPKGNASFGELAVFNPNGTINHATKFYIPGPYGIAVGPNGRTYATIGLGIPHTSHIAVIDSAGTVVGQIATPGLSLPQALAIR